MSKPQSRYQTFLCSLVGLLNCSGCSRVKSIRVSEPCSVTNMDIGFSGDCFHCGFHITSMSPAARRPSASGLRSSVSQMRKLGYEIATVSCPVSGICHNSINLRPSLKWGLNCVKKNTLKEPKMLSHGKVKNLLKSSLRHRNAITKKNVLELWQHIMGEGEERKTFR